jgi:hypothetical protein
MRHAKLWAAPRTPWLLFNPGFKNQVLIVHHHNLAGVPAASESTPQIRDDRWDPWLTLVHPKMDFTKPPNGSMFGRANQFPTKLYGILAVPYSFLKHGLLENPPFRSMILPCLILEEYTSNYCLLHGLLHTYLCIYIINHHHIYIYTCHMITH